MTNPKDHLKVGDIKKPHETVADPFGDGFGREPLTVLLGDLWNDFVRVADEQRDPDAPILQWD